VFPRSRGCGEGRSYGSPGSLPVRRVAPLPFFFGPPPIDFKRGRGGAFLNDFFCGVRSGYPVILLESGRIFLLVERRSFANT